MEFWSTILSMIVGGLIGIGGWFVPNAVQRCQERKSVRAALRSEIQSMLAIVERRDYIRQLSDFVEAIRAGSPGLFQRRIAKDYDIVFRNNCNKLGLLPSETAAKTVQFYHLASSVVQDLNLLQDAGQSPGLQERYGLDTLAGRPAFHEQMLQLSHETFDLGIEVIQELA
jgi:hypothetical protein